jgi:hypothetical protein
MNPIAARSEYTAGSAGATTAAPAWVGAATSRKEARRTARIAAILPSARLAVLSLTDALPVSHHTT